MDLELVTIGTELLLGFTVDTNSAQLAQLLAPRGIRVARRTTVPDHEPAIRSAVGEALARTGTVITSGGLGPTRDDVTKTAVAGLFDAPLELDEALWTSVSDSFKALGRELPASNRSQALVPKGAEILPNRWGTAPGLWLEGPPGLVIMLPGVPHEFRKLIEHEVAPRLAARGEPGRAIVSRLVRTVGLAESAVNDRLTGLDQELGPITIAYLPQPAGVDIRLTAWNETPEEAAAQLGRAAAAVVERVGIHHYGQDTVDLPQVVLDRARQAGLTIGLAESCTGGLVGGRLTSIPGSSDVVIGCVMAYHNRVKTEVLGVPGHLIDEHGAVSEAVARAMAVGAQQLLGVQAALSTTGIAGPSGGSETKPVGTVWIGIALGDHVEAVRRVYPGSRSQVRSRATAGALFELLRRLPS